MKQLAISFTVLVAVLTGTHCIPPNVVMFVIDDLGWSDVGYHNVILEARARTDWVELNKLNSKPTFAYKHTNHVQMYISGNELFSVLYDICNRVSLYLHTNVAKVYVLIAPIYIDLCCISIWTSGLGSCSKLNLSKSIQELQRCLNN